MAIPGQVGELDPNLAAPFGAKGKAMPISGEY